MRRFVGSGLVLATLLLLPGCGKTDEANRAAGITPPDALALVSVNLDPSVEQQRNLVGIVRKFPDARDQVKGGFEDARDELLGNLVREAGLDYERDVKTWLGKEVALAVLPPGGGEAPLVVLLIETTDQAKAKAALEKSRAAGNFEGEYRFVEEFVVFSEQDDPADNARALDVVQRQSRQDDGGLARNERFTKVVDELHGDRLVLGWADAKGLLRTADELGVVPGLELAERFRGSGPVAVDLHARESAFVVEGVAEGTKATGGGKPELTEGLPADTLGAFTFFNLGGTVGDALRQVGAEEGDVAEGFRGITGLDLEADILSWMKGEAVLVAGAVPDGQSFPDFALVVEPSDRARAEAALPKIRQALAERAQAQLEERTIGDTTAYVAPAPLTPGIQPAMALFADRFVVANRPEYLQVVSAEAAPGLGGTRAYDDVVGKGSSDETAAQLVVQIDPIRQAIEKTLEGEDLAEYQRDAKPNLEPLRAFGMVARREGKFDRFELKLTFDD